MQEMKRETWPAIMSQTRNSVLILAPWLDDNLITELLQFLPPVKIQILFPSSTLEKKGLREFRNLLRQAMDINLDVDIRVVDEDIAACLVENEEQFYFSKSGEGLLRKLGGKDVTTGIAYARGAWEKGTPWS